MTPRARLIAALILPFCAMPIAAQAETAEGAARTLLKSQVSATDLDNITQKTAAQLAVQFQADIQPKIKRALTDDEKRQLQFFWYDTLKSLMNYRVFEDLAAPVIAQHLTLAELQEINQFFASSTGRKFRATTPVIAAQVRIAGEEMGRKFADKEWTAARVREMQERFPQWSAALTGKP